MPKPTDMLQCVSAIVLLICPEATIAQTPDAPVLAQDEDSLSAGYEIPHGKTALPAVVGPRNTAAPAARSTAAPAPAAAPRRKFEPQWSREIGANGPSVELAALGGGRSDAPSLVHFAFSWSF